MTRASRPQYFYHGQQLIAVLEEKPDGWRLTIRRRDAGTYATREEAIAALNREEGEP